MILCNFRNIETSGKISQKLRHLFTQIWSHCLQRRIQASRMRRRAALCNGKLTVLHERVCLRAVRNAEVHPRKHKMISNFMEHIKKNY